MRGRRRALCGEASLGPGAEASRAMPKVDFGAKPASPAAERDGGKPRLYADGLLLERRQGKAGIVVGNGSARRIVMDCAIFGRAEAAVAPATHGRSDTTIFAGGRGTDGSA